MRHVICFGNELHGDDGFGTAVYRRLAVMSLPADARLFEAGTRGLDVLRLFEGCEEAILVDAAEPAGQPGRLAFPDPDACAEDAAVTGHGAGLGYLLRALAALGAEPRLRIVTAEAAAATPFRPGLSAEVELAAAAATAVLCGWLELASV